MRILLLAPHPFYQDRGTPIAVDLMLRVFSDRGDEVEVVTFHEGMDRTYPGVSLFRIPSLPMIKHVAPGFSIKKLICDGFLLFKAWGRVRAFRPHILHAVEESVFLARFLGGIHRLPYVYDMDSCLSRQLTDKHRWLRGLLPLFRRLEQGVTRGARAVVPVCQALADTATSYQARRIALLPDILLIDREDSPPAEDLPDASGIRFMYVGNLEAYQGIDLLLDAVAHALTQTRELSLVIVGGTESHIRHYQHRVDELGIKSHVHLIGPRPLAELGKYLAAADVLVSPRIQGENTPMKIYSYLASGKPVLATRLPTHTQVLSDDFAVLAGASSEAFSEAMIALIEDQPKRQKLGECGREYVQNHYSFESFSTILTTLYQDLEKELKAGE